jgi:hydroxypyruvate isomerase
MDRRAFIAGCAVTAGGAVLFPGRAAMAAKTKKEQEVKTGNKMFADAPLRMSVQPGWFKGKTIDEKLAAIAEWGFPAYEWLGPDGDLDALKAAMDRAGLQLSCMNGAGAIAPRQMVDPTDHDRVVEQFKERVQTAHKLGCKNLVGLTGNERTDASREEQTQYVIQCLKRLAPIAEAEGVTICLEALNPLVDHQGYFLTRTDHAMEILQAVNSPNVKMLFDIYHQQITEGNVIRNITQNIARIGHFHVADNPGRKQPGTGELNYKNIFKAIYDTGYQGYVALECGKTVSTEEALTYLRKECLTW